MDDLKIQIKSRSAHILNSCDSCSRLRNTRMTRTRMQWSFKRWISLNRLWNTECGCYYIVHLVSNTHSRVFASCMILSSLKLIFSQPVRLILFCLPMSNYAYSLTTVIIKAPPLNDSELKRKLESLDEDIRALGEGTFQAFQYAISEPFKLSGTGGKSHQNSDFSDYKRTP